MKPISCTVMTLVAVIFGACAILYFPDPYGFLIGVVIALLPFFFFLPKGSKNVIKIGPFQWSINDFCRGWLITGQTGSGKTACAIRNILHALFQDVPDWGGAVVDQKGQFYDIVRVIAEAHGAADKLVILRVGRDAKAKYNLLSYPGISWTSYAALIIDTAESMGVKINDPFWKNKAEVLLRGILQMVSGTRTPTLSDLAHFTSNIGALKTLVNNIMSQKDNYTPEAVQGAIDVKGQVFDMPEVTMGGIFSSAQTMCTYFSDPGIKETFCPRENTVDFRDVDKGKIFIVSMPQRYDRERIFFNTFLKLLFATHAKYRFDDPETLPKKNLLVFLADEAQMIVTSSKYASDHESVSVIREAKATYVLATQSTTSLRSKLDAKDVDSLILNLSSKMYFTVADQQAAESASKDLGEQLTEDKSINRGKGGESESVKEVERPVYTPAELRALKKYQCVIKHPSGKTKKLYLPPLDAAGKIPSYYYKDRFWIFWYPFWLVQF